MATKFTTRKPTIIDRIKGAFWRMWYKPYAALRMWSLKVGLVGRPKKTMEQWTVTTLK